MKRAWASIQDRISTDPNILHGTDEYHLRRLSTGRYAWISSRKTANFIRNKDDCSLVFMNSPFNWQLLAFGVPIGSPYISDFENTCARILLCFLLFLCLSLFSCLYPLKFKHTGHTSAICAAMAVTRLFF